MIAGCGGVDSPCSCHASGNQLHLKHYTEAQISFNYSEITNIDEFDSDVQRDSKNFSVCSPSFRRQKKTDDILKPKIIMLDGKSMQFQVQLNQPARRLFDCVCNYLQINERQFFGLYFRDTSNRKIWLNLSKNLGKQIKNDKLDNWIFVFRVKFYPSDPGHVSEEITRYYLTLQLRNDIISQKISPSINILVTICAYVVQSEIGDFNADIHGVTIKYIEPFNFVKQQDSKLLEKIALSHRTLKGITPRESDIRMLTLAMKLHQYGQHYQVALENSTSKEVTLAVDCSGLTVYCQSLVLNFFPWQMIVKIKSQRRLFILDTKVSVESDKKTQPHVYRMRDEKVNDAFLALVIEHHVFFRLKDAANSSVNNGFNSADSSLLLTHNSTNDLQSSKHSIDLFKPNQDFSFLEVDKDKRTDEMSVASHPIGNTEFNASNNNINQCNGKELPIEFAKKAPDTKVAIGSKDCSEANHKRSLTIHTTSVPVSDDEFQVTNRDNKRVSGCLEVPIERLDVDNHHERNRNSSNSGIIAAIDKKLSHFDDFKIFNVHYD